MRLTPGDFVVNVVHLEQVEVTVYNDEGWREDDPVGMVWYLCLGRAIYVISCCI